MSKEGKIASRIFSKQLKVNSYEEDIAPIDKEEGDNDFDEDSMESESNQNIVEKDSEVIDQDSKDEDTLVLNFKAEDEEQSSEIIQANQSEETDLDDIFIDYNNAEEINHEDFVVTPSYEESEKDYSTESAEETDIQLEDSDIVDFEEISSQIVGYNKRENDNKNDYVIDEDEEDEEDEIEFQVNANEGQPEFEVFESQEDEQSFEDTEEGQSYDKSDDMSEQKESKFENKMGEDILFELLMDYSNLQDLTDNIKEFLIKNIELLTKERVGICLEMPGNFLKEYKEFFQEVLEDNKKEYIYTKLREVEIQYLFENFIQCFDVGDFVRKRSSIDGKEIRNIIKLNDNILVDVYKSLNVTEKTEIEKGICTFIPSHKFELNIEEYIEDIKNSKLNYDCTYFVVLSGTIVDEEALKNAERFGVKIIKMDMPISIINRNIEEIKKNLVF